MRKLVAGTAIAASLVGGSAAIAAINPLGLAGAGTTTLQQGPDTTQAPAAGPDKAGGDHKGRGGGPHARGAKVLDDVLNDLVQKGTITQAQADAVRQGVKDKIGKMGGHPGMGHGLPGMDEIIKAGTDIAAKTIGIDPKDLVEGVKSGKTVAQIAQEHGVDPQGVIDALVAAANTRIDKAVTDGQIPADKADHMKQWAKDAITTFVNEGRLPGGFGKGGGKHPDLPRRHPDLPDNKDGGAPPAPTPPETTAPPTTAAPTTAAPTTAAPTTAAPTSSDAPASVPGTAGGN